jgi:hypothetical protein
MFADESRTDARGKDVLHGMLAECASMLMIPSMHKTGNPVVDG